MKNVPTWLVVLAIALGACGGGATSSSPTGGDGAATSAIQQFADQGNAHLDASQVAAILAGGAGPDYDSSPATSGPHAPNYPPCGVFREELADIYTVHAMEHGVVVVFYDPATVSDPDRDTLEQMVRDVKDWMLITPRAGLQTPVVAGSWTRLLELPGADVEAIKAMWDEYGGRGPEQVPCPFAVDESAP